MNLLIVPFTMFFVCAGGANHKPKKSSTASTHTTKTLNSAQLAETYAKVSADIATYFSSACIYLLTHEQEQDNTIFLLTSKFISAINSSSSATRPNAVINFSEYHKISRFDRCYVPLQVVIDNGHSKLEKDSFAEYSHKNTMHGTDQYNGGVWLLFLNSFDDKFIDEYFSNINTPFDIELLVAWIDKDKVFFKEAYRVNPYFPLRKPYMGEWSEKTSLKFPIDPLHYSRRTDLEGLKLKTGYVESPPISEMNKETNILGGYFGNIWHVLMDAMNASANYSLVEEFGFYDEKEDRWSGLLAEIKFGNIDIGVGDFVLTRDRFDIMDFSFPLIVTTYQVFYQDPGSQVDAHALFLPLGRNVWLTVLAWLVVGSLALYYGCYATDVFLKTRENFDYQKAFFFVLGALCFQGSIDVPKKVSSRILFFLTFLVSGVLIPSYSAALISYLTVNPPIIPFTNLKQLYDVGNYRLSVLKNTYEYSMFSYGDEDSPTKRLYNRDFVPYKDQHPVTYNAAIKQLCKNKWLAFFGVQDFMRWNLNREEHITKTMGNCMVAAMPKDAGKVSIGMAFQKKSHYKGLINHHVRNLQSIGIMARLKRKFWPTYNPTNKDLWTPVGIENTFMIFAIFGAGILLAILLITSEKLIKLVRGERHKDEFMVHAKTKDMIFRPTMEYRS